MRTGPPRRVQCNADRLRAEVAVASLRVIDSSSSSSSRRELRTSYSDLMTRNSQLARGRATARNRGCDANARDLSAVVGVVIAENLSASVEEMYAGG